MFSRHYSDAYLQANDLADDQMTAIYSNWGMNIVPNKTIVFEVAYYPNYDEKGNFIDIAAEQEKKQYIKEEYIPLFERGCEGILPLPVKMFMK